MKEVPASVVAPQQLPPNAQESLGIEHACYSCNCEVETLEIHPLLNISEACLKLGEEHIRPELDHLGAVEITFTLLPVHQTLLIVDQLPVACVQVELPIGTQP